ncbi:MAG: hypothetical protein NTZ94_02360, partial [Verrucomicrobia bacterium]|nr:hypothetical protein [Verrucomicrobiota bacterium]
MPNRARLGGDDGRAGAVYSESLLDFGYGLLGSELGEAGGGVLTGEILGGDLRHAGGGEEGDGYGGEKGGDEQNENESA